MKKIGIDDKDVDDYFDILDERVYDKVQPDDVHQKL